jgi:hypothetical protein
MNPLIFIPDDFIETTEYDKRNIYSDTDSDYLLINLPFNKFDDIRQLVDYVQTVSKRIDKVYNEALNHYGSMFGGYNPKYNTMKFKSEVVAYQGFFLAKKFYALGKIWDEGVFFDTPKIKETGGQIKKADATKITKRLLTEIYKVLTIPSEVKDLNTLYRKIFIELKNQIKMDLKTDIENMNFESFGVPKKWGFKAERTMQWVTGARLYNTIVEDTFRPGESMIMVPIIGNFQNLIEYFKLNTQEGYYLQPDDLKSLSTLSIPTLLKEDQKKKLSDALNQYNIKLNFDEIMNFNIDMKLEPFEKLFPQEIIKTRGGL